MSGKSSKRLKKRAAATYKNSAQAQIDAMKPWMVIVPHVIPMSQARAMIEKAWGKTPSMVDIEIKVSKMIAADGGGYVINVDELRRTADTGNIPDPMVVEKRTGVGLSTEIDRLRRGQSLARRYSQCAS